MFMPAKARRTGKPSPSRPLGAVVTDLTGRSLETAGSGAATFGSFDKSLTVTAGMGVLLIAAAARFWLRRDHPMNHR
jgi:hypothetical protein